MTGLPPAELGELEAMRSLLGYGDGAHAQELGGALCIAFEAMPTSAMFNRALGLGLTAPATEDGLAEIAAFFAERGVPYGVTVTPDARPPELGDWLEARGFVRGYAWTKFARAATSAPGVETDLRVEQVGADAAGVFADVFLRAYGAPDIFRERLERLSSRPGWHCFVAFAGAMPAATAALFVTGGVGWLGVAGTLPELRGRGAQNALLAARIEAGREAGCKTLITETGSPRDGRPGASYRNIVRAGFEPVYVRENYLSSPEADTSGTR